MYHFEGRYRLTDAPADEAPFDIDREEHPRETAHDDIEFVASDGM